MSTEYLHYVTSVSHINRRDKKDKTGKGSSYKDVGSSEISTKSFRYKAANYESGHHKLQDKKSILVAESDSEILSMLKLYLNSLGYDYDTFSAGDEVLDQVYNSKSSKKKKYDIILLDTYLDKISGLAVANEIRKTNSRPRIMIMSTTPKEHLPYELIKNAQIHDADLFTKPFRLSELLYSLER
jgi:CheY-like chemotaxis protein